jgi:hypothetical protein
VITLKGKLSAIVFATLIMALAFAPVEAVARVGIYGYVDQVQYAYGEGGRLKIWIMNEGTEALILHNITIIYPWNAVLPWEGNQTLKGIDAVVPVGGNKTYEFEFTVPNDRGALAYAYGSSSIVVRAVTDKTPPRSADIPMSISNAPVTMTLQDMNNLVTLLTVQIVIAIIAAIIIAAAVFLSGRRPGVTWQKEE